MPWRGARRRDCPPQPPGQVPPAGGADGGEWERLGVPRRSARPPPPAPPTRSSRGGPGPGARVSVTPRPERSHRFAAHSAPAGRHRFQRRGDATRAPASVAYVGVLRGVRNPRNASLPLASSSLPTTSQHCAEDAARVCPSGGTGGSFGVRLLHGKWVRKRWAVGN